MTRPKIWTLDDLVLENRIKLGRGDVISKKDIAAIPGNFPIYSSAQEKNGVFGFYGKYMFDEELITWSVDGGGKLFYRPKHKFSVTNVGGTLRILDPSFLNIRYLYFVLTYLHSYIKFDWVFKAHPSVLRKVYNTIPIPDLNTQLNLVEKLDKVFAEFDSLEKNLQLKEEKTNQLIQSILSAAFTDIEDLDINVEKLEDVCLITRGKTITKATSVEGDVPVIGGGLGPTYYHNIANVKPPVITVSASGANAGFVNFWDEPIWASDCSTIIEKPGSPAIIGYIYKFLQSSQVFINSKLRRGSAQPHVYSSDIGQLRIPLPSINEQKQIVEKLDEAFAEIDKLKKQISIEKEQISSLRKSILSNAFNFEEKAA